jgi:hypothetical protein
VLLERQGGQVIEQLVGVAVEVGIATHLDAVAIGQRRKRRPQLVRPRHWRALHQHRNDGDVAGEGILDLAAHAVVGIVQPAAPVRLGDVEPAAPDDDQHGGALAHRGAQDLPEVSAERDRVDIFEDVGTTKAGGELVVQEAAAVGGVVAAIGDEELAHAGGPHPPAAPIP